MIQARSTAAIDRTCKGVPIDDLAQTLSRHSDRPWPLQKILDMNRLGPCVTGQGGGKRRLRPHDGLANADVGQAEGRDAGE